MAISRTLSLVAVAIILFMTSADASAQNAGVAATVGTLGPGVQVALKTTQKLNVRVGGSYFAVTVDDELDDEVDVVLEGDARVGAFSALADYHVFGNSFRISGGARINLFEVHADGVPAEPYCFGDEIDGVCRDKLFQPERLGTLGGTISYPNPVQPYLGLGFGNLGRGESRVTVMFDLGVIYTGSPEIDLEATGLLTPTASGEQEDVLNEGLESFVLYPVFSFGIGVRI